MPSLDRKYRPEAVANPRPHPRWNTDKARLKGTSLAVTNGHALAVIPVDRDCDEPEESPQGILVPIEALKRARINAGKKRKQSACLQTSSGRITVSEDATGATPSLIWKAETAVDFPDVDALVDKTLKGKPSPNTHKVELSIDAKLLHDLANAIGAKDHRVTLTFDVDDASGKAKRGPVLVSDHLGDDAFGLLMPVV